MFADSKDSPIFVLASRVRPLDLNPLLSLGWESVMSMLILAFPDVRWLFGTVQGYDSAEPAQKAELDRFRTIHGLHQLFSNEPGPIFDGAGLRKWVLDQMLASKQTRGHAVHLPQRKTFAIGFDEESDYAHLHAYTAYRFGFRATALTTKAQADCVLKESSDYDKPEVVFEDLFLNLPDAMGGYSWLGHRGEKYGPEGKECQRHAEFRHLEEARFRVVVTSGHRPSCDEWKKVATDDYIADKLDEGLFIETLLKPHAGIFSIWSKTKLSRRIVWEGANGKLHRGTGEGYIWPPDWKRIERDQENCGESSGHSAQGILLVIAEQMIDRAERMLGGVHTVEEALLGAVLATDALELLGGKTPTMSIAALTLKHRFEVMAVLQFAGVEYHFPVENRIKEIEKEVESISRWFAPAQRRNAALNAEMSVLNVLVRTFRDFNQFDEEQVCMNRVRHLHNTLWMRTSGWGWAFWPVMRYFEILLSSFPKFCLALLAWLLILSFGFAAAGDYCRSQLNASGGKVEDLDMHPFWMAFSCFLGAEPLTNGHWLWIFLTSVAAVAGLAHLGIFISHLYTIVSRK